MKSKFHKISIDVFKQDIIFTVGTTEKEIQKYLHIDDSIGNVGQGRTVRFEQGHILLWVEDKKDRGVIAHEIFHVVHFMCDRIGIKLSMDSDEVFAYCIDYITTEIYKILAKH